MTDAISLAGKTVLITGASAGIGWATALAFAENGANVVVTARREERLRKLCATIAASARNAVPTQSRHRRSTSGVRPST